MDGAQSRHGDCMIVPYNTFDNVISVIALDLRARNKFSNHVKNIPYA